MSDARESLAEAIRFARYGLDENGTRATPRQHDYKIADEVLRRGWQPPDTSFLMNDEIEAAASAMFDVADEQMRFPTGFDQAPEPLADTYRRMARAALLAARKASAEEAE